MKLCVKCGLEEPGYGIFDQCNACGEGPLCRPCLDAGCPFCGMKGWSRAEAESDLPVGSDYDDRDQT